MTLIDEFCDLRHDLLIESRGEDGFIDETGVLDAVVPLMLDAKLVDSENYEDYYVLWEDNDLKLNG